VIRFNKLIKFLFFISPKSGSKLFAKFIKTRSKDSYLTESFMAK